MYIEYEKEKKGCETILKAISEYKRVFLLNPKDTEINQYLQLFEDLTDALISCKHFEEKGYPALIKQIGKPTNTKLEGILLITLGLIKAKDPTWDLPHKIEDLFMENPRLNKSYYIKVAEREGIPKPHYELFYKQIFGGKLF